MNSSAEADALGLSAAGTVYHPVNVFTLFAEQFFDDRRVREALSLVLDFEWMNKNLFHSQYKRIASFFPKAKKHASLMFHKGAEIAGDFPIR